MRQITHILQFKVNRILSILHFLTLRVIGSRGSMLQYSKWSVELFEMARNLRRESIAGDIHDQENFDESTKAVQPQTTVKDTHKISEGSGEDVMVKREDESRHPSDDVQLSQMQKLAISNETKTRVSEEASEDELMKPAIQIDELSLRGVVDLTQDETSTSFVSDLPNVNVKQEARPHITHGWLQPDASSTSGTLRDMDVAEFDGLDSDDPIKIALLQEYNQLSECMAKLSQQAKSINEQMKDFMLRSTHMQKMLRCRQELEKAHSEAAELSNKRNIVVAKLLVYSNRDPAKLEEMLATAAVDSEHAQSTIHRKCIMLESVVYEKRKLLRTHKLQMDDTIRMKSKDSYAEVARIAADIQNLEKDIIELDRTRLEELEQLLIYSKKVREAAIEMLMPADEA